MTVVQDLWLLTPARDSRLRGNDSGGGGNDGGRLLSVLAVLAVVDLAQLNCVSHASGKPVRAGVP